MSVFGDVISAGANIIGGIIGRNDEKDARIRAEAQAAQNIQLQKDFAQQGIRWKVEDAKQAGIHPLFALGASTHSFAPVSVGETGSNSLGKGLAAAGQNIGRAVNATRTGPERQDAVANALILERGKLQNDLLATQLASSKLALLRQAGGTPPGPSGSSDRFLIEGQPDAGFKDKPSDRVPAQAGAPHQEAGAISDVGFARTPTGWAPVPSENVKERIEDNKIAEFMWAVRNMLLPSIGVRSPPPNNMLGSNMTWRYDPTRQEYYRKFKRGASSGGQGW